MEHLPSGQDNEYFCFFVVFLRNLDKMLTSKCFTAATYLCCSLMLRLKRNIRDENFIIWPCFTHFGKITGCEDQKEILHCKQGHNVKM